MRTILTYAVIAAAGIFLTSASGNAHQTSAVDSFQNDFATCTVRLNLLQARNFVLGKGAAPLDERCLGPEWAQATFRSRTFRYALAKVLLLRDYKSGLPNELSQSSAVPLVGTASADSSGDNYSRQLAVADCVVRKDPTRAFALVETETGEASAEPRMLALAPVIAGCSAGKQLDYPTGFEMHEAIVTRMYQLAYAARRPSDA